jgi:subtilisin family serine protease
MRRAFLRPTDPFVENQVKNFSQVPFLSAVFAAGLLLLAAGTIRTANADEDSVWVVRGERPPIDLSKVPANAFEKGIIHIKFKQEMTGHLDATPLTHDADGSVRFGLAGVDNLNRTHHARKSRLLFSENNDRRGFTARHRLWGFHLWHTLELDSSADIRKIISEYQNVQEVEFAEPEYKKTLLWMPNDSQFGKQWHYHNTGQNGGTAGCDIHLPEAWDIAKGNPSVVVAVIDGGIKYDHPDLAANMWRSRGYNFVNNSATIVPFFHSTHVAGTVAAVTNNGIGVSGIAGGSGSGDGVRLMSCQVFTATSSGGFAQAFKYAADSGAAIAQNSWGYTTVGVYEQAVLDAIDYFNENGGGSVLGGGITIFAAGNSGSSGQWYPGCYSGVIAVAATNNKDQKSYYSNYDTWVDISAPGGEMSSGTDPKGVYSTYTSTPDTLYGFLQGTSMACPHVSGVAALVLSYAPGKLSSQDLRNILLTSTDNIDALNPSYVGKLGTGRLNAFKALVATQPYLSRVSNPVAFSATPVNPTQINLAWLKNASNDSVMVAWNLNATFGTPAPGTAYGAGQTLAGGGTVVYNGSVNSFSHAGLLDTMYYYKAWSVNGSNVYSTGKTVSADLRGFSRAITVSVPGPGLILFEATGTFVFNRSAWTTASASLSLNTRIDDSYKTVATGNSGNNNSGPYDITRALAVTAAGSYTAFLVGDMSVSGVSMANNNASAIFFPY